MEQVRALTGFYEAIKDDKRIGPTHISLYMALFKLFNLNRFCNPINITRASLMETAKISGLATYHKWIKDLHEFRYIRYIPSFNPAVCSRVFLKVWDKSGFVEKSDLVPLGKGEGFDKY